MVPVPSSMLQGHIRNYPAQHFPLPNFNSTSSRQLHLAVLWSKQATVPEVAQALVQLIAISRNSPFHSTEESGRGLIFTFWSSLRQHLCGWSSPAFPKHVVLQMMSPGQWPYSSQHGNCQQAALWRWRDRRRGVHFSLAEVTSRWRRGVETWSRAWSCSTSKAGGHPGALTNSLDESQLLSLY